MHQVIQLLTLCVFAGSTCAVFYIPGSVVSYPKMGKRTYYTNATGSRYPLIGRRSSSIGAEQGGQGQSSNTEAAVAGAVVENGDEYNKRGVFTQGPHRSYPRVGRSGSSSENSDSSEKIRSEILKGLAERLNRNVMDVLGSSDISNLFGGQRGSQSGESIQSLKGLQLPQFLFLVFDEDGDSQLSKAEFTSGLAKVLEQNLLC